MKIEKTRNTPYIFLDKVECILDIKGLSYPEHPGYFYQPLLEEINNCLRYLQDEVITINIALEMMNSTSQKYIFFMVRDFVNSPNNIVVNWYYEKDDEDMEEEGDVFKESFPKIQFNLHQVKDIKTI
tara:strand:+ start:4741 stop:5121 length:381 start_codon:yes stop_codon:yes gene_type:complete